MFIEPELVDNFSKKSVFETEMIAFVTRFDLDLIDQGAVTTTRGSRGPRIHINLEKNLKLNKFEMLITSFSSND